MNKETLKTFVTLHTQFIWDEKGEDILGHVLKIWKILRQQDSWSLHLRTLHE